MHHCKQGACEPSRTTADRGMCPPVMVVGGSSAPQVRSSGSSHGARKRQQDKAPPMRWAHRAYKARLTLEGFTPAARPYCLTC